MATIVNSTESKFINQQAFTDETAELTINGWTSLTAPGAGRILNSIAFGMSLYGPNDYATNTMVIPFESIDPYDPNGYSYYYTLYWDISKYQRQLRVAVANFTKTDIYVYFKGELNGNTYVFWDKCTLSITSNGALPLYTTSPSYTIMDSTTLNLTGKSDTIIRYVSDVKIAFNAAAQKEGSIYAYTIKNGSQSVNIPVLNNQTTVSASYTFNDCDSPTFYTTVEDSRGYSTNNFAHVPNFIEYFKPTCRVEAQSPSTTGGSTKVTATGIAFNGSFGASVNTIKVYCRFKSSDSSSWSDWFVMSVARTGKNYTATLSIPGLDYLTTYSFEAKVQDSIMVTNSSESQAKAMPVFDWGEEDFRFNVPVNIIGDLVVSGTISSTGEDPGGNTGDAKVITSGTWTPVCAGCSSPDYAYGTYMRIGDTCVVNFYFQGTIATSQEKLMITGLPFNADTSYRWQSGGGFCNNYGVIATTSSSPSSDVDRGNHRFVGWSIEGNVIYGRTQNMAGNSANYTETEYTGGAGRYRSWRVVSDGYYIGGIPTKQLYASGTICYKIDT